MTGGKTVVNLAFIYRLVGRITRSSGKKAADVRPPLLTLLKYFLLLAMFSRSDRENLAMAESSVEPNAGLEENTVCSQ